MKQINWGIIGCGDVTEVKSGPAFNRIKGSRLAAVMRRNAAKAEDYAKRHNVPEWTDDAGKLISDPGIDAVYVATPPSTHAQYAIMAAEAGKHVYVEKPMGLDYSQCQDMIAAAAKANVSLFVAYYRRALPSFLKIKELVEKEAIGRPLCVNIRLFKPVPEDKLKRVLPWRFQPEISGGGLFVDLASHQLDYLHYLFGPISDVKAYAFNQRERSEAEDLVCASFVHKSGVVGNGTWCFSISNQNKVDQIDILGTDGKITFSTFDFTPVKVEMASGIETFEYPKPHHVQEHFIQTVVDELSGRGHCPGTAESASHTTKIIDEILKNYRESLKESA